MNNLNSRELRANIQQPQLPHIIPAHPKTEASLPTTSLHSKPLRLSGRRPEKAGVGGSIPCDGVEDMFFSCRDGDAHYFVGGDGRYSTAPSGSAKSVDSDYLTRVGSEAAAIGVSVTQSGTHKQFARDLQERLVILGLFALSAPFRICKLQILLAGRETDPVSGHHLESITYKMAIPFFPT
jgi:hypothetical protein